LCHDYYNSVTPQRPPKQGKSQDGIMSQTDCANHHTKVCQWFLQPDKYCTEITNEQKSQENASTIFLSLMRLRIVL